MGVKRQVDTEHKPHATRFRQAQATQVVIGLLEIVNFALPDTFWKSDSRVQAARKLLGNAFPTDDDLMARFHARPAGQR